MSATSTLLIAVPLWVIAYQLIEISDTLRRMRHDAQ
jgi:hypothetical protein